MADGENGAANPPDGTITIILRLTPTPGGYAQSVNVLPAEVYPETVIEACERAARMLLRNLDAKTVLALGVAQTQQSQQLNREVENVRRRLQS